MSIELVAEYPNEGFAILRDGGGTFVFDRSDSILPINADEDRSLRMSRKAWEQSCKQSAIQDEEDSVYNALMH